MRKKEYIEIGSAFDLKSSKQRRLFRVLEILPGVLAWLTIILVVFLSWQRPVWIAIFIICFDVYWLLKTVFLSFHQRSSFNKMKNNLKVNWLEKLDQLPAQNWKDIYHLIILPTYKEDLKVVRSTFQKLVKSKHPLNKFIVVLAIEERAGEQGKQVARAIKKEFGNKFFRFLVTIHPKDIVGEIAGKGANETWAAKTVKREVIDPLKIPYENIIVSCFDIDTQVYPYYFACLTYNFLTCKNPLRSSFQPIPVYNNNIWEAPAISRVVAMSATFWYMIQQERPERLATFSSHSMSFKAAVEVGFWPTKNVSEDSRIYWKSFLYYDGDYDAVPLYYPVSMDANLAKNFIRTMINVFKQQARWGWGVENVPYFTFGCIKNKAIKLKKKLYHIFNHWEGFWSWATNSLLIFILGWLPLFIGGPEFNRTILSYNLPRLTRIIMTLAMVGLVTSAFYSLQLLPPRPKKYSSKKYLWMILQWILIPLSLIVFGAIPAFLSQTRLMLGKYMGFWVTEKERKQ